VRSMAHSTDLSEMTGIVRRFNGVCALIMADIGGLNVVF
jgi:hypothetical protein